MQLNAIMCVWNEEDIISATVKHAFAQGCSNVYLIDNSSTDDTVNKAIDAGAKFLLKFNTKFFDEFEKINNLNAAVMAINKQSKDKYTCWMYIDADEFRNIDSNLNICNFLNSIDSSIGAIHGHMYNHIPTHKPYYINGYHPIDFMQICNKNSISKIPLIRYLKDSPHIYSMGGAHTLEANGNDVYVMKDALNIHHFNFREFDHTLKRLRNLIEKDKDGTSRIDWMDDYAKRIHGKERSKYHGKLNNLCDIYSDNKNLALKTKKLPYNYSNIKRWYKDLNYKNVINSSIGENLISHALYYYYNKEYIKSFYKFCETTDHIHNMDVCMWVFIKLAECASYFDRNLSSQIINKKDQDSESMFAYINSIRNKNFLK